MDGRIFLVDLRKDNATDNLIGILFDNEIGVSRHENMTTLILPYQAILSLRKILNAFYDIEQGKQSKIKNEVN